MSTPANDLVALAKRIAAAIEFSSITDPARYAEIISRELAPTLDALRDAQEQIQRLHECIKAATKRHIASITDWAKVCDTEKERTEKAEADCAAVRVAAGHARDALIGYKTTHNLHPASLLYLALEDLKAALATNAGQPLLDELARLRAEYVHQNCLLDAQEACEQTERDRDGWAKRAEAAESALRMAREALVPIEEWMTEEKRTHQQMDENAGTIGPNQYVSDLCQHLGLISKTIAAMPKP